MMGISRKEKLERLQDKNLVIEILNKRVEQLNQELLVLRSLGDNAAPLVFSIIEDKGKEGYVVKIIIRQIKTPNGYQLIVI